MLRLPGGVLNERLTEGDGPETGRRTASSLHTIHPCPGSGAGTCSPIAQLVRALH